MKNFYGPPHGSVVRRLVKGVRKTSPQVSAMVEPAGIFRVICRLRFCGIAVKSCMHWVEVPGADVSEI